MDQPLVELENLISLQNYFKLNRIAYVMYFGLDPEIHTAIPQIQTLLKQVDKERIFRYNTHHMEWCIKNKHTCTEQDPHPNEKGVELWSKEMFDWIEENKFFDTIS
jgi:lysophospholipase L1-like esterase